MLDRSRPLLLLRPSFLAGAAGVAFALCAAVPALAAGCLFAGFLAFALCWLGVLTPVLIGLAVASAVHKKLKTSSLNDEDLKALGCLSILGIAFLIAVVSALSGPLSAAGSAALNACDRAGVELLTGYYLGTGVANWSLTAFVVVLAAAGGGWAFLLALRREHRLNYALFKIAYACPACHQRAVPHFRCPGCGDVLANLGPSAYGLLKARCGCGRELPTTDFGGRRKLAKVCANPDCRHELTDPDLGRYGEYYLAVVGAAAAGKTTWLTAALAQLEQEYAPQNRLRVAFGDPADAQRVRAVADRLRRGEHAEKTPAGIPRALTLTAAGGEGQNSRMYFYDAAGDTFSEEVLLARQPYLRCADGVVFVLDASKGENARDDPTAADAQDVLARLVNHLETAHGTRAGRKLPLAVAVVVTASALESGNPSEKVRDFLVGRGLANLASVFAARFPRVQYFAVGAGGLPEGAAAPLVWLATQVRALGVRPTAGAAARNWLRTTFGSLRRRPHSFGVTAPALDFPVGLESLAWTCRDAFRGRGGWRRGAAAWLLAYGLLALVTCGIWNANRSGTWSARYVANGEAWAQKGDDLRAVADYTHAIRINPRDGQAHFRRGEAWLRQNDAGRARDDFVRAGELLPARRGEWSLEFINRGDDKSRRGDVRQAADDYNWAIHFDPANAAAYFKRGIAWYNMLEDDRAAADFGRAIELRPQDPSAHYNRALCWTRKKAYARAAADYAAETRLNPTNLSAWKNLAWLRTNCPDPAVRAATLAVAAATRACELTYWGEAESLDLLAAAHAAANDLGQAVRRQQEALRLLPAGAPNRDAYQERLKWYEAERDRRNQAPGGRDGQ